MELHAIVSMNGRHQHEVEDRVGEEQDADGVEHAHGLGVVRGEAHVVAGLLPVVPRGVEALEVGEEAAAQVVDEADAGAGEREAHVVAEDPGHGDDEDHGDGVGEEPAVGESAGNHPEGRRETRGLSIGFPATAWTTWSSPTG